jgi:hypothetical protein
MTGRDDLHFESILERGHDFRDGVIRRGTLAGTIALRGLFWQGVAYAKPNLTLTISTTSLTGLPVGEEEQP